MMKLFPTPPRTSTFAVRMHKTSLVRQEGALSFRHPLKRMKAAIHLQAKPSWLWGSTMFSGALSVWGHFSSLGFCYALFGGLGFFFLLLCWLCWVLVGSWVPGAVGLGSGARLMSPSLQPMAVTSWPMAGDIRARIQHLAGWEPPEQRGFAGWGGTGGTGCLCSQALVLPTALCFCNSVHY